MRGRPAKPTAIKRREGNPGKRPLNESEPSAGNGPPRMPPGLTGREKTLWRQLCQTLGAMGVLDKADGLAIRMMCSAYEEWQRCRTWCRTHGDHYVSETGEGSVMYRAYPQVAQGAEAWRRLKSLVTEFGLTPAARVKLGNQGEDEDPLGEMLKKMGRNN